MFRASVGSLAEVFASVPDSRDPRGVRHSIQVLVSLVFLGMLARIREMAVLQRWAELHWQELGAALGSNRDTPPNATTISRALAGCSLAEFRRAFAAWLRQMVSSDEPWCASVDGKTVCQGLDAQGNPVHLLTVFVHHLKVVLGQWSVGDEKSNEPAVLKHHLSDTLRAVSDASAANWRCALCPTSPGGSVDEPRLRLSVPSQSQPTGCARCLASLLRSGPTASAGSRNDRKKGALTDRRRLWLSLNDADYIRDELNFPGCRIGLRVDRDVLAADGETVSHDSRYFVTSLDPGQVTAAQLLEQVRDHWQIENSHFFLKDRWWDEDRHATRRPGLADCLAILNSMAVTVLRCCHPPDQPLRARADHIAWNPTLGLRLLGLT